MILVYCRYTRLELLLLVTWCTGVGNKSGNKWSTIKHWISIGRFQMSAVKTVYYGVPNVPKTSFQLQDHKYTLIWLIYNVKTPIRLIVSQKVQLYGDIYKFYRQIQSATQSKPTKTKVGAWKRPAFQEGEGGSDLRFTKLLTI